MTARSLESTVKGTARYGRWIGFAAAFAFCWLVTGPLESPQRLTVLIATAAVLFWVFALIDEWLTGAAAVLALWASGSIGSTSIAAAATHDLVLLLIIATSFRLLSAGSGCWMPSHLSFCAGRPPSQDLHAVLRLLSLRLRSLFPPRLPARRFFFPSTRCSPPHCRRPGCGARSTC